MKWTYLITLASGAARAVASMDDRLIPNCGGRREEGLELIDEQQY